VPADNNALFGQRLPAIAKIAANEWHSFNEIRKHKFEEEFTRKKIDYFLSRQQEGVDKVDRVVPTTFGEVIGMWSPWPATGTCWLHEQAFDCLRLRSSRPFAAFPFFAFDEGTHDAALTRFEAAKPIFQALDLDDPAARETALQGKQTPARSLPIGYDAQAMPWRDTLPYDPTFTWNFITGGYLTLLAPEGEVQDGSLVRQKWLLATKAEVRLDLARVMPPVEGAYNNEDDFDIGVAVKFHGAGKDSAYSGVAYCALTQNAAHACVSLPRACQIAVLNTPTASWIRAVVGPLVSGPRGGGGDGRPFVACSSPSVATNDEIAKRISDVLKSPPFLEDVGSYVGKDGLTLDGERSYQSSAILAGYREVVTMTFDIVDGRATARSTIFVSRQNSANIDDYRGLSTSQQAVYRDVLRRELSDKAKLSCDDL
jgi:hypothetical protein